MFTRSTLILTYTFILILISGNLFYSYSKFEVFFTFILNNTYDVVIDFQSP